MHAQEMWGISSSNYSGTTGVLLNPSSIVGAPYKYTINILSGDHYFQNSYFYIPSDNKVVASTLRGEWSNATVKYDALHTTPQSGFFHTLTIGPSFYLNNGQSAWGFHTAYRNEISALDVPYTIVKMVSEKFDYAPYLNQDFHSDPFSIAMLSWGEVGVTYGKVLLTAEKDYIKWGATVNALAGFDGAYLDVRKLEYQFPDSATGLFHSVDASLAHAFDKSGDFNTGSLFAVRGMGASTSLGATYIHNRDENAFQCSEKGGHRKYQYRLGISLIDIGKIRFKKDAEVTTLQTTMDRTWNNIDTAEIRSFTSFDQLVSNEINGAVATQSQPFSIWLPAALSLQFDYHLVKNIYAGAAWMNRIKFSGAQVNRNNQGTLMVRYETKKFETGTSLTFTEYREPSAGYYLRYSFFVLGTDRVMEWLSLADVNSFDFYFGFSVNFCELRLGKKKTSCVAYGTID